MTISEIDKRFPLAEMSAGCRIATWLAMVMACGAVAMGVWGVCTQFWPILALPAIVVASFALVWCYYRPTDFVVSEAGLTIRWPLRSRLYPADEIERARIVAKSDIGWSIRLWGAGGLWGVFGLCWSRSMGKFDAFVSRKDGLVLIALRGRRLLLITPDRPEEFITALTGQAAEGTPAV